MVLGDKFFPFFFRGHFQCFCRFGKSTCADHFRCTFQCVHEDLIILPVRRFIISSDQGDLLFGFDRKLNQERLIEIEVVHAVFQTAVRIDRVRFELFTKRDRSYLRRSIFTHLFKVSRSLFFLIDLFIRDHGFREYLAQDTFQFLGLDRLTDKSVEALCEEHLLGRAHGVCSKSYDRHFSVLAGYIRTDLLHRFDAIHTTHHVIHENNVESLLSADIDRLLSRKDRRHFHTIISEDALSDDKVHRLVIDDQCAYALAEHLKPCALLIMNACIQYRDDRETVERFFHDSCE